MPAERPEDDMEYYTESEDNKSIEIIKQEVTEQNVIID